MASHRHDRARPTRQPGLNQQFPRKLADDLARKYQIVNRTALPIVERRLVPAIESGDAAQLAVAFQTIDREIEEELPDAKIESEARRAGELVDRTHRSRFFAGLAILLGIQFLGSDDPSGRPVVPLGPPRKPVTLLRPRRLVIRPNFQPGLFVDQFVKNNVRFISTLRSGVVDGLRDQIVRASVFGEAPEVLAERLRKQWRELGVPSEIPTRRLTKAGVPVTVSTQSHAELIARDQISKLNSEVSRARMEAAGIEKAKWRTQGDSDVRPKHVSFGKMPPFNLATGINGIFPGMEVNCRCWSQAVLDRDEVLNGPGFIDIDSPSARGTIPAS